MTLEHVPITLIGGRGPHGLALHLWMRDRGLDGAYALVDPAPTWLPTYGDGGLARFTEWLRSPRELDFSLGDPERAMTAWCDADSLAARGERADEDDERTIVDLLVDQVEFADVVVISKADLVDEERLRAVEARVRALNAGARILRGVRGEVPLDEVVGTGRFDLEAAANSAAWIREMAGVHTPETEEYDIRSTVFRARRPFHPGRLARALENPALLDAVRAKGVFWLATRPAYAGLLSKAGPSVTLEAMGEWWAVQPEGYWDLDPAEAAAVKADWHDLYGDRAQQLVWIGIGLDVAAVHAALEAALIDDAEEAAGLAAWATFDDPLPAWG